MILKYIVYIKYGSLFLLLVLSVMGVRHHAIKGNNTIWELRMTQEKLKLEKAKADHLEEVQSLRYYYENTPDSVIDAEFERVFGKQASPCDKLRKLCTDQSRPDEGYSFTENEARYITRQGCEAERMPAQIEVGLCDGFETIEEMLKCEEQVQSILMDK